MSENSVIKIQDLHFSYGSPVILEDIQLDIKAKEGNLIIWPSHLVHGSMPININKKRIIVSANASVNLKKE